MNENNAGKPFAKTNKPYAKNKQLTKQKEPKKCYIYVHGKFLFESGKLSQKSYCFLKSQKFRTRLHPGDIVLVKTVEDRKIKILNPVVVDKIEVCRVPKEGEFAIVTKYFKVTNKEASDG